MSAATDADGLLMVMERMMRWLLVAWNAEYLLQEALW